MSIELAQLLYASAGVAGAMVIWDLGRRFLHTKLVRDDTEARAALQAVLLTFEQVSERNDKALTNFLTEVREITRHTERSRREAEGQALTNQRRR